MGEIQALLDSQQSEVSCGNVINNSTNDDRFSTGSQTRQQRVNHGRTMYGSIDEIIISPTEGASLGLQEEVKFRKLEHGMLTTLSSQFEVIFIRLGFILYF